MNVALSILAAVAAVVMGISAHLLFTGQEVLGPVASGGLFAVISVLMAMDAITRALKAYEAHLQKKLAGTPGETRRTRPNDPPGI